MAHVLNKLSLHLFAIFGFFFSLLEQDVGMLEARLILHRVADVHGKHVDVGHINRKIHGIILLVAAVDDDVEHIVVLCHILVEGFDD